MSNIDNKSMFGIDDKIEKLYKHFDELGVMMPLVARGYFNSLAFFIRRGYVEGVKTKVINRAGKISYITSGHLIRMQLVPNMRNIDRMVARVGAIKSPNARDPEFMKRIETGGAVKQDRRFGGVALPSVEGARSGNLRSAIPKRLSLPAIAASAVDTTDQSQFAPKQKIAVALSLASKWNLPYLKIRTSSGNISIYRRKGKLNRKKKNNVKLTRMWTMAKGGRFYTGPKRPLERAVRIAGSKRVSIFRQEAARNLMRKRGIK